MKKLFTLIAFMSLTLVAFSQRVVTGSVLDVDGEALIGANVIVENTKIGTVTDFDGNFELEVPADAKNLVVSYTGFGNQILSIDGLSDIAIVMETGELLDEVVVTALGVSRDEKALGYAVQTVSSKTISDANTVSAIDALAGAAAGVQITTSGGTAGGSSRIVLRGQTSFNGNNEALIVIDGIRLNNDENHSERSLAGVNNSNRAIDINPDDIANVSILKGAAATALYGIEGARGVVLITTKRGKNNDLSVGFSTGVTFSEIYNDIDLQETYLQGSNGVWRGPETGESGSWGPNIADSYYDGSDYKYDKNGRITSDPSSGPRVQPYDNIGDFFQNGFNWRANLSVSGGTEKTDYRFSFGYSDEDGTAPKNTFTRYNFGLNVGTKTLNDKLDVSFGANFVNTAGRRVQQGSNTSGVMLGLLRTPVSFDNSNGLSNPSDDPTSYVFSDNTQRNYRGGGGYDNPYWVVNNAPYRDKVNRFYGNLKAKYHFSPWFNVGAVVGTDLYADNRIQRFEIGSRTITGGQVIEDNFNYNHYDMYFSADGGGEILSDLTLNYTVGLNLYDETWKNNFVQGDGLNFYGFMELSNTASVSSFIDHVEKRSAGIYGQLDFGYKNFLYLNFTGRNDWSSTLINPAAEFNGGDISFFYPSVSLGIVFSELIDLDVLSFGKIRASYAEVGGGAPSSYSTSTTYVLPIQNAGTVNDINDGWTLGLGFPFKGNTAGFVYSAVAGNPNLKPSRTKDVEFGVDLRFLRDRISFDATYYNRDSEDQIIAINIPNTTGFQRATVNSGALKTKGGEIVLNIKPIQSKDLSWNVGLNWSKWKTTVESLPEGVQNQYLDGFSSTGTYNIAPETDANGNITRKFEFGQLLGGAFQHINSVDVEGNPVFDPSAPYNPDGALVIDDNPASGGYGYPLQDPISRVIGNPNPDWLLGITNTITYKDISLSFLFDLKEGGDLWNGTKGALTFFGRTGLTENRESVTVFQGVKSSNGASNDIVVPTNQGWYQGNGGGFGNVAEHFIEDGSFRRLRYVTLSYNLGNLLKGAGFERLSVSFTGRNLFLDTDYSGYDPELSLVGSSSNGQGLDYFGQPGVRSYSFGISAQF